MIDIQNLPDSRKIAIDQVGVRDLCYPITVLDRANKTQHTVARINMLVNLPHNFRGTHMSRFIEILNEHYKELHIDIVCEVLQKMKAKFNAEKARMEVTFPYFIEKSAPVSHAKSLMEYNCTYIAELTDKYDAILGIEVPLTTLCPCSKELSDRGAHNQRSIARIRIRYNSFIWIEELIEIAENSASSPLYALLKRVDEKKVTEHAYDNPMFVEDMVREIAKKLNNDDRITWYSVESENMESIHNHNAYAAIERKKII
jgi:GTP cyclohydrolase I